MRNDNKSKMYNLQKNQLNIKETNKAKIFTTKDMRYTECNIMSVLNSGHAVVFLNVNLKKNSPFAIFARKYLQGGI